MSALSPIEAVGIVFAGLGAGTINTIVGAGTLITFPVLLAVGYAPVVANVSNTVGLVPGSISGVYGYRRELTGQRSRLIRLGIASALGALTGGALLLVLPAAAFKAIVPALIAVGCFLVVAGPRLSRRWGAHRHEGPDRLTLPLFAAIFAAGVYGGYFGAAQGVILIGILSLGLTESMQRINAAKNLLALVVNAVSATLFILAANVAWLPALLIAIGSIIGGQIGAKVGRRIPDNWLRAVVVLAGVAAIVRLLA